MPNRTDIIHQNGRLASKDTKRIENKLQSFGVNKKKTKMNDDNNT